MTQCSRQILLPEGNVFEPTDNGALRGITAFGRFGQVEESTTFTRHTLDQRFIKTMISDEKKSRTLARLTDLSNDNILIGTVKPRSEINYLKTRHTPKGERSHCSIGIPPFSQCREKGVQISFVLLRVHYDSAP